MRTFLIEFLFDVEMEAFATSADEPSFGEQRRWHVDDVRRLKSVSEGRAEVG